MPETQSRTFTFGQVQRILASYIGAHESKRKRLIARLQQLQRLGLPKGTNVGKSARAQYQMWQVAELAFYLDLLDAGVTPATLETYFRDRPIYSMDGVARFSEAGPYFVAFHANALGAIRSPNPHATGPRVTDEAWTMGADLAKVAGGALANSYAHSPMILIDLGARLRRLKESIVEHAGAEAAGPMFPASPAR